MLVVGAMLLRSAVSGQRCWMHGPDSASPHRGKRYGPFVLQQLAACLVIADPLRHVLGDVGLWVGCSNNPTFSRINSTDPFPTGCYSSSYQYRCTVPCCVPTWRPAGNGSAGAAEYAWLPPQSQLPELATLRPDGTVYLPPGYAASQQPWEVFKPGALLWASGRAHAGRGGMREADCEHGVNNATGYCFLVDEATPMSYADRLKLLPLRDVSKPFNAETSAPPAPHALAPPAPTPSRPLAPPRAPQPHPRLTSALPCRRPDPHECNCDQCSPSESIGHLAPVGILFTLVFTYLGFLLLALALAWRAPHLATRARSSRPGPRPLTRTHTTRTHAAQPEKRGRAGPGAPATLPPCTPRHPLSPEARFASLHRAAPACWWLVCRCLPVPPPCSAGTPTSRRSCEACAPSGGHCAAVSRWPTGHKVGWG